MKQTFGNQDEQVRLRDAVSAATALHSAARTPPLPPLAEQLHAAVADDALLRFMAQLNDLVREVDVSCSRVVQKSPRVSRTDLATVLRSWRALLSLYTARRKSALLADLRFREAVQRIRIAARRLKAALIALSRQPVIVIHTDRRKWSRGGAIADCESVKNQPITKAQVTALLELGRTGNCRASYKAINTSNGLIELLRLPEGLIERRGRRTFRGTMNYVGTDLKGKVVDHRDFDEV